MAPNARATGIRCDECRQSRDACTAWTCVAQDHLSQDGNREFRGSGGCSTLDCKVAVCRPGSHRHLGLERWWFVDAECDVSLPRRVCDWYVGRARAGSALLRHDLPGTLLRVTQGSSRGVEAELADHFRWTVERQSPRRAWNWRRQRPLPGH